MWQYCLCSSQELHQFAIADGTNSFTFWPESVKGFTILLALQAKGMGRKAHLSMGRIKRIYFSHELQLQCYIFAPITFAVEPFLVTTRISNVSNRVAYDLTRSSPIVSFIRNHWNKQDRFAGIGHFLISCLSIEDYGRKIKISLFIAEVQDLGSRFKFFSHFHIIIIDKWPSTFISVFLDSSDDSLKHTLSSPGIYAVAMFKIS